MGQQGDYALGPGCQVNSIARRMQAGMCVGNRAAKAAGGVHLSGVDHGEVDVAAAGQGSSVRLAQREVVEHSVVVEEPCAQLQWSGIGNQRGWAGVEGNYVAGGDGSGGAAGDGFRGQFGRHGLNLDFQDWEDTTRLT